MLPIEFEVNKDDIKKEIRVYNELYLYGEIANTQWAEHIAEDIENAWNAPYVQQRIGEEDYTIRFEIKGYYEDDISKETIVQNIFPWRKYFHLVASNTMNISFVDGLFSNTGEFLLKNIEKQNSKTGAHEWGHSWGLKHPKETDYRGKGVPHIMLPRGSFVDPEYRYKPKAELIQTPQGWMMEEGFTMDTNCREVLPMNIIDLGLTLLSYNSDGYANLSALTNRVHF